MQGSSLNCYSMERRAHWFAAYLTAFNSKNREGMCIKLKTNPTIRLLIQDNILLKEIKTILT